MSFLLKQSEPSDITRGVELNGIISSNIASTNNATRINKNSVIELDTHNNTENDKKIKLLLNAVFSGGVYNNCGEEKSGASIDNEVPKVRVYSFIACTVRQLY